MNTPSTPTKLQSEIKVSFHMDRETYEAIQAMLDEISSRLDVELTMPKFLKRTVQDGWKVQAERYLKLDTRLRRRKSEAPEVPQKDFTGAALPPPIPKASLAPAPALSGPK